MANKYGILCTMQDGSQRLVPKFDGKRLSDEPELFDSEDDAQRMAKRLYLKKDSYKVVTIPGAPVRGR